MMDGKQVTESVVTLMRSHGFPTATEYTLPNGRRLDVAAFGKNGNIIGVEVKISARDFTRDTKWADAMRQCFLFYFAVPVGFPIDIIHPSIRVIACDGENARIVRRAGKGLLPMARHHEASGDFAARPVLPDYIKNFHPHVADWDAVLKHGEK